ncbi:hypothetical protein [Nocardia sp. CS682]|uniref:hypothetical protein n=1 Tax=Nocardia sp. CS682 TaxID=1047172 RepID=UPI0010754D8A|nr:hypothetical protein [Nocardia sp. CS682]
MADVADVLLKQMESERAQAMHSETQRSVLSNMILVLSAAGLGFLSQRGLRPSALVITLPLLGIGLYGALATAKFYERFLFHYRQECAMRSRLDALLPELGLVDTVRQVEADHDDRNPISRKVRIHVLWESLHLSIAAIGLALTIVSVL